MRPTLALAAAATARTSAKLGALLWTIQIALALLFLFAGVMKFVIPIEQMTKELPLSGAFLRFVGVCEIAGALGLFVPALLRLSPVLTPLAAGGLVVIMIGATVLTLAAGQSAGAAFPAVVGLLAAFVAYRRGRVALHRGSARGSSARLVADTRAA